MATIEVPPNKSIAAGGGVSIGGAIVTVAVWASGLQPPPEVLIALTTISLTLCGFISTYLTPSGATIKDES